MMPLQPAIRTPPPRLALRAVAALGLALAFAALACGGERSSAGAGATTNASHPDVAVESAGSARPPVTGATGMSASEGGMAELAASAADAVAVIRAYYEAISAHRLHDAYHFWSDNGAASNQTFEEFAHGFDDTRSSKVTIGRPGRVEGAAGSRYVEIPVTIDAVTTSGEHQRFTGCYLLRRAVVPGATEEQRSWRIYRAEIHPVE